MQAQDLNDISGSQPNRDLNRLPITLYGMRGLLPAAILVNVRDENGKAPFESVVSRLRILSIPEDAELWVVDGQHRLFGLERASEQLMKSEPHASLGYDVPVMLTIGLDGLQEMLFHIVNSKVKSVDTHLAAELLRRAIEQEGKEYVHTGKGGERDFRKAVNAEVAIHLNSVPGPWQGKIRMASEPKDIRRRPLQINAIASSLEPAL